MLRLNFALFMIWLLVTYPKIGQKVTRNLRGISLKYIMLLTSTKSFKYHYTEFVGCHEIAHLGIPVIINTYAVTFFFYKRVYNSK